jgi:plasmid stability protein
MLTTRSIADSYVAVRVPHNLREELAALAAERDRTVSAEARRALRLYLKLPENRPVSVEVNSAA